MAAKAFSGLVTDADMEGMIADFMAQRTERKRQTYHTVVRAACGTLISAMVCLLVAHVCRLVQDFAFATVFHNAGLALFSLAVVATSTCPTDELDIDLFFAQSPKGRVVVSLFLSLFAVLEAVRYPPHLHAAAVAPMLVLLAGRACLPENKPRASELMALFFLLQVVALGVHAWCQHFKGDSAEDNPALRRLMLVDGVFALATAALLAGHWVEQRLRFERSGGQRGASPTLLFFFMLYAWVFVDGALTLAHGVTLAVQSRGRRGWSDGVVPGVLILLPVLVVAAWGRQHVFNVMARHFDRVHGEHDGAFIAELMATKVVEVDAPWWVRREQPAVTCSEDSQWREWIRGRIESIDFESNSMTVVLPENTNPPPPRRASLVQLPSQWSVRSVTSRSTASTDSPERVTAGQPTSVPQSAPSSNRSMPLPSPRRPPPIQTTSAAFAHSQRSAGQLSGRSHATAGASTGAPPNTPNTVGGGASQSPPTRALSTKALSTKALFVRAVSTLRRNRTLQSLDGQRVQVSLGNMHSPAPVLLQNARANLRCVDWDKVTAHVFESTDEDFFHLSRAVRDGERIDFFLSHSWHDPPRQKWDKLSQAMARFRARHGRNPTCWIDKVCIDQSSINDGLRVLCVNVMAARKVLVLCGPTYPTRLWCSWEIFTLFSFQRYQQALERIELVLLETGAKAADGSSALTEKLANFDVANARCFDPNEEATLRKVIQALGQGRFNDSVRQLAADMAARDAHKPMWAMRLGGTHTRARKTADDASGTSSATLSFSSWVTFWRTPRTMGSQRRLEHVLSYRGGSSRRFIGEQQLHLPDLSNLDVADVEAAASAATSTPGSWSAATTASDDSPPWHWTNRTGFALSAKVVPAVQEPASCTA